ncbi:hypothetical protein [Sphingomonas crusticola]|uniref:hypothetical protein n=1 Tax=Sphingomonas crusticola TaxID=1697973 RepID=UPI0013C34D8A|nr:hypothetical protein [Sphingomonas crusticola]
MTALRRHLTLHRWPAAWLVALALAVRLIVPAGFMPMAGHAALEICAGQTPDLPSAGPMAAMPGMAAMDHAAPAHAMDHGDHGKPMSGASDHDCGFAAAVGGAGALPTLILPAMLAPVALPAAFLRTLLVRPGHGLAAPPPPKTGPPILS